MVKDAAVFSIIIKDGQLQLFPASSSSIEAEKSFIRINKQSWKQKTAFYFTVKLQGSVIGAVGITPEFGRPYNAEIAYFVDKELHGKDYALQAVMQAEYFAKVCLLGIRRLQALIIVDNLASISVFEKAGYHREGQMQKYLKFGDRFYDAYIYGKIIR
jgi:ribosomal-protein-alanine N-acetyltransferase